MKRKWQTLDKKVTDWMRDYGTTFLRFSLAIIFIWFGALKVVGYSPATELVANTVYWFDPSWFVPFLGLWEVLIGLLFLKKQFVRGAILLLAPQMVGTFLPLILLPQVAFSTNPLLLTLEGQYIVKNLLIIGAAIVVGSHVRDKK
jgi:uncharacterized membrane protein YkgB